VTDRAEVSPGLDEPRAAGRGGPPGGPGLPSRTRLAVGAGRLVGAASRGLRRGDGVVVAGRVALAFDRRALGVLAAGRSVALVSGTNGKTTTTRLLALALGTQGPVATNAGGANLPAGLVTALGGAPAGAPAALEVDEAYLGAVAAAVRPRAIALLNLTRDQLDRVSEVRRLGQRWRSALGGCPALVVANADDPIVAWAAMGAARVVWVAAGQPWRKDATGCPRCEGRIRFGADGAWACEACGLERPAIGARLGEGDSADELVFADGRRYPLRLGLPGRFNRTNAVVAAVTAEALGVPVDEALEAMSEARAVAGRYGVYAVPGAGRPGVRARLLLAKNPAGFAEIFEVLSPPPAPVVVGINARVADGRDPSWLWDVGFERLAGRVVVATGERCLDLAVRLRYAEVVHRVVREPLEALRAAAALRGEGDAAVDVVANYTCFHELWARLRGRGEPAAVGGCDPEPSDSVGPAPTGTASGGEGARPRRARPGRRMRALVGRAP
jgi:UDP-N-acetylmuramyl tripeptide synthase